MTNPSAPTDNIGTRRKRFKEITFSWWKRRGLPWSLISMGALGSALALWPLAATAWDLLGLDTVETWRLTALSACALMLVAGVAQINRGRTSPIGLVWLVLVAWVIAAGAVTVLTTLAWLALDTPLWQPPEELTPKHADAIATRAFAIVAGLGGVALLVIAYRRQRTTENGEQREVTKLFTERFTTAVGQLGEEEPAVRLGGVHALAHLADDASSEEEVQMVIDVLCAYLRMPYTSAPLHEDAPAEQQTGRRQRELEFASFREVRHTIIRVIGSHLRKPTRWRGKDYDFTGAVFDGGDLTGAHFTDGTVLFHGANFSGGVVSFNGAKFTGGRVSFNGAQFGGGVVRFNGACFTDGEVDFDHAGFIGGVVAFGKVHFNGGCVSFGGADFRSKTVSFHEASFIGGHVYFDNAGFTDGVVSFTGSRFTRGVVDFDEASGKRPKGLPDAESPIVVNLPAEWRFEPDRDSAGS